MGGYYADLADVLLECLDLEGQYTGDIYLFSPENSQRQGLYSIEALVWMGRDTFQQSLKVS